MRKEAQGVRKKAQDSGKNDKGKRSGSDKGSGVEKRRVLEKRYWRLEKRIPKFLCHNLLGTIPAFWSSDSKTKQSPLH